ncbi:sigma-54-dependent transcriptional regulator [Devosia sp.]|uniref:sigma-54-dependent transcriptional regulator n=1 Tax=Devosia sp. TaxID=1871048 RepID=UPI003A91EB67
MTASGPGPATVRILLVERDMSASAALSDSLATALRPAPAIESATGGRQAADVLRSGSFDVVLADLAALTDLSERTEDAVSRLARLSRGALLIALSDGGSVSASLAAMRAGAHDHVARPVGGTSLAARITELAERHGKSLSFGSGDAGRPVGGLIGSSSQMRVVYDQITRIATAADPVFITGESGTGKTHGAEVLHKLGRRAARPFVAVDCASSGRDRLEQELFGVTHGAVAGLSEDRPGAAERADGGTLLLDEISEMDLGLQGKLLRLLQTGTVSRLGETGTRRVDVRVICTTCRNPMELIGERRFREDLFYRLHVLPLHLPPLRQRTGDVGELARQFLSRFAGEAHRQFTGFSADALDHLNAADWPGNVRQLRNLMRRIAVMFEGGDVTAAMLAAADLGSATPDEPAIQPSLRSPILPLWQQEQRIIEDAIASFGGNITLAAAALELSPSTIYRKRQAWAEMAEARGAA